VSRDEEPIAAFLREAELARQELSADLSMSLRLGDIEDALLDLEGFERGPDLLYRSWSAADIVARLRKYDFSKYYSEVMAVIDLPESIVPAGTFGSLEERIVRMSGERWYVHKNDADPFPSNPHAHNYEKRLKLSLVDGGLYHKKKRVGKVDLKTLVELRNRLRDFGLPDLVLEG
jgi:hypothetical protein